MTSPFVRRDPAAGDLRAGRQLGLGVGIAATSCPGRHRRDGEEALANLSLEQLCQAVLEGTVHRLRPKLLTEGTVVIGLAPLLRAAGTGAEVIKPMAALVLGGILIADEVIDLLLPVQFYHVRRRCWQRLRAGVD